MKRGAKLAGERTDDNGGFDWMAFLDLWWEIKSLPSIGFFNMNMIILLKGSCRMLKSSK